MCMCCAAQDKVWFKLQLSSSLWKSLSYPAPKVSSVAVKPCCAEFNTHAHERTDKHTCRLRLNDPGVSDMTNPLPHQHWHTSSLIARCPQRLSSLQGHNPCSPSHPLCSPPFAPRAFLQFLGLLGSAAAVGTRQVAIGINEPKLSPLVKCSHLTHLWRGPAPAGIRPLQDS